MKITIPLLSLYENSSASKTGKDFVLDELKFTENSLLRDFFSHPDVRSHIEGLLKTKINPDAPYQFQFFIKLENGAVQWINPYWSNTFKDVQVGKFELNLTTLETFIDEDLSHEDLHPGYFISDWLETVLESCTDQQVINLLKLPNFKQWLLADPLTYHRYQELFRIFLEHGYQNSKLKGSKILFIPGFGLF